jgi:hypothetical protein
VCDVGRDARGGAEEEKTELGDFPCWRRYCGKRRHEETEHEGAKESNHAARHRSLRSARTWGVFYARRASEGTQILQIKRFKSVRRFADIPKAQYALRAGVESSLSQGIRRFDLRRSRYLGLARTHLQQLLNATAMDVVRVIAWLWGEPLGERRRSPGHFAQLALHPLSRQTVLS